MVGASGPRRCSVAATEGGWAVFADPDSVSHITPETGTTDGTDDVLDTTDDGTVSRSSRPARGVALEAGR
jgi:hypothetical protein